MAEQGDGLCALHLEGQAAAEVLARLVPLDLHEGAFPVGTTARTMLGHMVVSLTRQGPLAWEVLGMRSMAGTLVAELSHAMAQVAAREAAGL